MDVTTSRRKTLTGLLLVMMVVALPLPAAARDVLNLDDYKGKVVVLDFWASWCVPCRRSFPWMNEMQDKYTDDGLVIIAVNLDNSAEDAAEFLRAYPAAFNIIYDLDKSLAREYSVQAMPSSFLINRHGEVIEQHMGFKVKKQFEYEASIVEALSERQVN